MSTLPSFESILLQVHQSLGCKPFQTTLKRDFATGQKQLSHHKEMAHEIFDAIFDALDLDPQACGDIMHNVLDLANFNKHLELNTWTFAADKRQILWMLQGYSYAPSVARVAAFWNLEKALDKGMPGGRFWYLPEPREVDGKPNLYLPVAQVVDWLLDLLGMPLEEFADKRSQRLKDPGDKSSEPLMRSLYNWRKETTPNPASFKEYFPDEMDVEFKGVFSLDSGRSPTDQFADALDFVTRKKLTADKLRLEIPMTQAGRLKAILDGAADEDERATFVGCLAERYAVPSPHTIRQRLLFARMVQDGYTRLLKLICPSVDRLCADASQNKLLQLFAIYKHIYNLTIDAWRNCREQGEAAENAWFEERLPSEDKHGLFLSILPSRRETGYLELAHILTRHFFDCQAGAELEDHVGLDAESAMPIIKRKAQRAVAFADELNTELHLVARMKNSSSWRALQGEHRYWVISQVANHAGLSPRAKGATIQHLRELASTPAQTVQAILLELETYLNNESKQQPKDTCKRVQALLEEAEACEEDQLWRAALLQYKAKHLLACNDFENAEKLFREALEASRERNCGPRRGEIARDCLAMAVANQRLIPESHEKYYREMLAGGMVEGGMAPNIEDTARRSADYFWNTLYRPYPGIERMAPLMRERVEESLRLLMSGDSDGLRDWMTRNRSKLNSRLPLVTGDSLLLSWIKGHANFVKKLPMMREMLPAELKTEQNKFEVMSEHWRQSIGLLAQQAPTQLNIADFKNQTPLMLMTEAGDTQLVRIMLKAGADPEMQDRQGMTALHSAIKSCVVSCVDALLDHPCHLDKVTIDGQSPLHTAAWSGNLHATQRLLQLAPRLAWERNTQGMTPLERVEYLINNPQAIQHLAKELELQGRRCATKDELLKVVALLEKAELPRSI
ncbi:ankyrin repeat domain-containing protein [Pseudomonas sp. MF6754]|uniref:ankyrin repeat domain-containing protein n=1 Tax=Pseudomonas sp. MF6754 TaxID=2797529 RepID=UPI00190AFC2B|nr:ankyrin repeat domain-containing protein [Pseudomonas sp. MF6754]MBK3453243.1 ankyrin repeat domain-containing protein [Pseudomonas sp. MF6754]